MPIVPDASVDETSVSDSKLDSLPSDSSDAGVCPKPTVTEPPGPRVTTRDATGSGPCAGRTLGSVIDAVLAAHPELADIKTLWTPEHITDGSFIHAFALPDGGFALVFKRGGGDCPAGCTENEYWYFRTDGSCGVSQVGHYHPTYGSGCVNVDGSPMWSVPAPIDPASVCGADLVPKDISGTFSLCADGMRTACTPKAGAEKPTPLPTALTIVIAQRKDDLSKGTVTLTGTGHSLIDGVPIDAVFQRKRFTATKEYSNLPSKCPEQYSISIALDFEGIVPGSLSLFESHTLDCATSGYCKGAINAKLVVR